MAAARECIKEICGEGGGGGGGAWLTKRVGATIWSLLILRWSVMSKLQLGLMIIDYLFGC